MTFTNENMKQILHNYGIKSTTEIEYYRNEQRLLAKVTLENGKALMMKGEKETPQFVEKYCQFATLLKEKGFPVPVYRKTVYGQFSFIQDSFTITLEELCCGIEIDTLSDKHIYQIGKLLAYEHQLSTNLPFSFGRGTSWSMFGGNKTDALGDYDENELSFIDFSNTFQDEELFISIKEKYTKKRAQLFKHWALLPKGPVQGDFCHYNMLFNENSTINSVFDFNIAGDEVFINECIAVGVYLSWHVPYVGNLSEKQRFEHFFQVYKTIRPLNDIEQECIQPLIQIIRAFRYDRVDHGITLTGKNPLEFLDETLAILDEEI